MLVPFGEGRWVNIDNVTILEMVHGKAEDNENSPPMWGIGFRLVGGEKVAFAVSEAREDAVAVVRNLVLTAGGVVPPGEPTLVGPDEMPSV